MQESFLEAFRRLDTYREESSFGSWLKKIVVHKAIDELRKTRELVSMDELDVEIADSTDEEDFMLVLSSRVEEIRKAIHFLPDSYRVILSLYLLEGYDHEEISQVLGISYNLSRTRYSRARKKLLELLGSREYEMNKTRMN
jgi:RNA polymerase sigma-70 factor (ECF subfamily)